MIEEKAKEEIEKNGLKWDDFLEWMVGQTISMDERGNTIYWAHDVRRFILLKTEGRPTYFD